jgi:multidrug efflux pump subunit AcrA (membrane-fusion protein)
MSASLWFLSVVLVLSGPDGDDSPGNRQANRFQFELSKVKLVAERDVAAQEAGLVTDIPVREGSEVKEGDQVGQISDSKARAARKVAEAEHKVALEEATNDISVKYAEAAAKVAEYDYLAHYQANQKARQAVPDVELKKLLLTWRKGVLETEKAELEFKVAGLTAKVKEASVEAADDDIERRRVTSPIDGIVIEIDKQEGEWVNPGDRIMRIVRMDKVRIEGQLPIADVSPIQVKDRPVTVEATISRNKKVQLTGRIVFVSPELNPAGTKFRVVAEVENREEQGVWILMKDMSPTVTVEAGVAADKPKTKSR